MERKKEKKSCHDRPLLIRWLKCASPCLPKKFAPLALKYVFGASEQTGYSRGSCDGALNQRFSSSTLRLFSAWGSGVKPLQCITTPSLIPPAYNFVF